MSLGSHVTLKVLVLWHAEAQLSVEIDIVVPGQPVRRIELAVRERHHFGKAGIYTLHFVDYTRRYHNRDITFNLYRSITYAWKAFAYTRTA